MIVENLGDHADAEVAKGVKQFTENFIKKRLKEVKYRTVEETWHVPLSEKESLIKKLLNMQNCLKSEGGRWKVQRGEVWRGKTISYQRTPTMLSKEISKQKACESNTSFKEGRLIKMRIESEIWNEWIAVNKLSSYNI